MHGFLTCFVAVIIDREVAVTPDITKETTMVTMVIPMIIRTMLAVMITSNTKRIHEAAAMAAVKEVVTAATKAMAAVVITVVVITVVVITVVATTVAATIVVVTIMLVAMASTTTAAAAITVTEAIEVNPVVNIMETKTIMLDLVVVAAIKEAAVTKANPVADIVVVVAITRTR
jgi:hypothetical protein